MLMTGISCALGAAVYYPMSYDKSPITQEWKIEISPKSIQTVRLSIPFTMQSLKWIGQGVLNLKRDIRHFCCTRVSGLDMTENRIFTLCRMVTWVVFFRMFWNFISSLPVKKGRSLSFLTIFTFAVPELLDLIWQKIGFLYVRLQDGTYYGIPMSVRFICRAQT
jgi:hypothetical protein